MREKRPNEIIIHPIETFGRNKYYLRTQIMDKIILSPKKCEDFEFSKVIWLDDE